MAVDTHIEAALRSHDPVAELRRLARHLLDEGSDLGVLRAQFEVVRQQLREADREDDENAIMDTMDFLMGWCSPHMRLPSLAPSEQIGDLWTFTKGVVTEARKYLEDTDIAPETIANEIAGAIDVAGAKKTEPLFEPGEKGGHFEGAYRLNVRILVSPRTYDLFLNHVNGYRGHYAVSEQSGNDFNQFILRKLKPRLVEHARNSPDPDAFFSGVAQLALEHHSAKIWEAAKPYNADDYDWAVRPEINFTRWIEAANEVKPLLDELAREHAHRSIREFVSDEPDYNEKIEEYLLKSGKARSLYKAIIAVRAPLPSTSLNPNGLALRVMSAWIRDGQVEETRKFDRARQLFAYGWT